MHLKCSFNRPSLIKHRNSSGLTTCCLARAIAADILERHAGDYPAVACANLLCGGLVRRRVQRSPNSETFKRRLMITLGNAFHSYS
jgi:hypothetical protein